MMDKLAEKLAGWFGSAPFILFHAIWFGIWIGLHIFTSFDQDWSALTLIVSLEAIFLSLFILRAENIEAARTEEAVKRDLRKSDEQLRLLKSVEKKRLKRK